MQPLLLTAYKELSMICHRIHLCALICQISDIDLYNTYILHIAFFSPFFIEAVNHLRLGFVCGPCLKETEQTLIICCTKKKLQKAIDGFNIESVIECNTVLF